jgi:flagellar protein FlbT
MPLRIELAPYEKLYIGRSVISNSHERAMFVVEGSTPLLRGRDFFAATPATVAEILYVFLQNGYLAGVECESQAVLNQALHAMRAEDPSVAAAVEASLGKGDHYRALKSVQRVIARHRFPSEWKKPDSYLARAPWRLSPGYQT